MFKTSYFLENVLYAPVNDENMTGGAGTMNTVNIVEDDILGGENSTQQMRDITMGACVLGNGDTGTCATNAQFCDGTLGSDSTCRIFNICGNDLLCTTNSCSNGIIGVCKADEDSCKDTATPTATTKYFVRFIPIALFGVTYSDYGWGDEEIVEYKIYNDGPIAQQWGSGASFTSGTTASSSNKTRYSLGNGLYLNGSSHYYKIGGQLTSVISTTSTASPASVTSSVTIYMPGHNGKSYTANGLTSKYIWLPDAYATANTAMKSYYVQNGISNWFQYSGELYSNKVYLTANCLTLTGTTTASTSMFKYGGINYSFELSGITGFDEAYYKTLDEMDNEIGEDSLTHSGRINVFKRNEKNDISHNFPFFKLYTPFRYFSLRRHRPGVNFDIVPIDYLTSSTNPVESSYTNKTTSFYTYIKNYGTETDEIMTLKGLKYLCPQATSIYNSFDVTSCLNKKICTTQDGEYGFYLNKEEKGQYTIITYYQGIQNWRKSTKISNPNSSLYDGVYESFSNSGATQHSSIASMYIDITDYDEFTFYIRSYGESNWDYVMVSNFLHEDPDNDYWELTSGTSYSDTTKVKAHTRGLSTSGTGITSYTQVTFSNIDNSMSKTHRIQVIFRRDSSGSGGTNQGFVLIPYQKHLINYSDTTELIKAKDFKFLNTSCTWAKDMIDSMMQYSGTSATYRRLSLIPYQITSL